MSGYILHIACRDTATGEPGESFIVRFTAAPEGLTFSDVVPGRPHPPEMPPFDLYALAAALIGSQSADHADPAPGGRRPRRRRHRHLRIVRPAATG
ncbi:hypothetical protein [Dactylosporangium sp. CA-092794]|uniref:hypothetical protein n=1 Tax=Dactylosporangium sp. CA-092794 TaxID=3239929 RepID=UPI003D8FF145